MKYSFSDVIKINEQGLLLRDGFQILFNSCREELNCLHHLNIRCAAERDITACPPCFEFYMPNEHVIIVFDKNFCSSGNIRDFHRLYQKIINAGYSSFVKLRPLQRRTVTAKT